MMAFGGGAHRGIGRQVLIRSKLSQAKRTTMVAMAGQTPCAAESSPFFSLSSVRDWLAIIIFSLLSEIPVGKRRMSTVEKEKVGYITELFYKAEFGGIALFFLEPISRGIGTAISNGCRRWSGNGPST